jgi:mono/diheme cytochrome c family protein
MVRRFSSLELARFCAFIGLLLSLSAQRGSVLMLNAQAAPSTKDGVYSSDQATRGAPLYVKNCASCHGAKLEGENQAPPLAGSEFTMNWNDQPLSDLFEKMQTSMPADKPGTLSAKENADILAYILRENRLPAGSSDLPADPAQLKQIKFLAGEQH